MRVQQTTLLTGPYDWDPAVLPRSVFEARLEAARVALAAGGAGALLVHGHPGDYGALAWLTAFVPKLGPALALVPDAGDIRLIVSSTDLMIPQARLLTWVEDVRPLANAPKLVAEWRGDAPGPVASWGFAALPHGIHRGIAGALAPRALVPLDPALDALRRRKSALELGLMREAARMLRTASDAFVASARSGAGARSAALAAERAAIAAGAQDARSLVSLTPGGAPLPCDSAADPVLDPVLAGIAVQHGGYWAAGYGTVARAPGEALMRAREGLAAALALAGPGADGAALLAAANGKLAPLAQHPVTRTSIGHAIGLSLDEGPVGILEPGATYMLAVGASAAGSDNAIVSALVAVTENGAESLWSSPA